jgi:hypothetical protein
MRFRNAALLYAAITLFWLQLEDSQILPVVLLGMAGAALLVTHWLRGRLDLRRPGVRAWAEAALSGALLGLTAALVTALLMVLKAGMHGHVFPDYPPGQILALLGRAPGWVLAGALAALGVLALSRGIREENPPP